MTNGRYIINTIIMKRKILSTILTISISLSSFAGGPWTQKKNKGFIQFQGILPAYQYKSLLMGNLINDKQHTNRKVFNSDYILYSEFGITDKIDIIANLPFKYVSTGDITKEAEPLNILPKGELFGLSNPELSLKYGILDRKVKIAASINYSFNPISKKLEQGLATGYDANSIGITAHVGRSTEKQYGFLEVGIHKYSNDFSDVVKIRIEHGWQIKERITVGLTMDARHSLENGSYFNENLAQTGLYPNDQSFIAISGKLAYEKDNGLGLSFSMPLIPIKFKYVGFNGTFAFGIYKKF